MEIAHTLGLMEASTHAHKAPRMLPDQPPTIGVEPGMLDLTSVERTDLCENVKHRDALTRIGTDSQFSEVYLNDDKVLKVMPYTFEQTPQECRTEFEIAKMLSSNDDGDPDKFVQVSVCAQCPVLLSTDSAFYKRAQLWSLFNAYDSDFGVHAIRQLLDEYNGRPRIEKLRRSADAITLETAQQFSRIPPEMFASIPVNCLVMTIETMRGDLGQIALIEKIDWSKMTTSIREAVEFMHSKSIAHNDLHIHNVLVNGGSVRELTHMFKIHDFGKSSRVVGDMTAVTSKRDTMILGLSLAAFSERERERLGKIDAQLAGCKEAAIAFTSTQTHGPEEEEEEGAATSPAPKRPRAAAC